MRHAAIFVWAAAATVALCGTLFVSAADAKRRDHCDIHISTMWNPKAAKVFDVDTLVEAEGEDSVISFRNKVGERTEMVRDELGIVFSEDTLKHQPTLYELVVVRDALPGDYAVNIRAYYASDGVFPFTASVVIDRAMHSRGSVTRLAHVNVEVVEKKTQYTAIQFHLEPDCTISKANRNPIHMDDGVEDSLRQEIKKDDTLWVR